MICGTGANGTNLTMRDVEDGGTSMQGVTWATTLPVWLKLVRSGDSFTGYTSFDGVRWTQAGSTVLTGAKATLYAGLAVTSHNDGVLSQAVFDNVTFAPPAGPPGAPVISTQPTITIPPSLFTYQIVATHSPTRYAAIGLPPGLTLNPDTGEIRGFSGFSGSTLAVMLQATNAAGTGSAVQTFLTSGGGPIETPYVRSFTAPADGTYRVGEMLLFQVTYMNGYTPPVVTGRPRIALTIGAATRYARYAWGSGTFTQVFAYTVQPGDVGAAGFTTSDTIDLDGGSMRDGTGLWCQLFFRPESRPGASFAPAATPSEAPVLTTPDTAEGVYDRDFSFQITATNAPTAFTAGLSPAPARPPGLSFDAASGVLYGRLQASGHFTFQLGASNSAGAGAKTLVLNVPHGIAQVAMPAPGTYRVGDVLTFRITFSNPVRITGAPSLGFLIGNGARAAAASAGVGQTHAFSYTVVAGDVDSRGSLPVAPQLTLNGGTIRDADTGEEFGLALPGGATTAPGVVVDAAADTGTVWLSQDIGAVSAAGSSAATGSSVSVRGSGADIWGTDDEFHFRYVPLVGDGELVARVTGITVTDPWAKAGIMIRETLASNARHHWIGVSAQNGWFAQTRSGVSTWTEISTPSWSTVLPVWVRITRAGSQITSYVGGDGAWSLVRTWSAGQTGPLYIGFAVTSHNDGVLCTAAFEDVRLTLANQPGAAPAAPTNLMVTVPTPGQVTLTWTDNSSDEEQFQVLRSTDSVNFQVIGTTAPNVVRFDDSTVSGGVTYYYRVRAANLAGASPYVSQAVTTPAGAVWEFRDIGAVGIAGLNSSGTNTITVSGAGGDVWGAQDAFRYVYRAVQGDVTVEAQLSPFTSPHAWARAGVMIRDSLDPTARNVFAFVTRDTLVAAQVRRVTETELTPAFYDSRPQWLRLVKTAARVSAQSSQDGITWTEIVAYEFPLGQTFYVGFGVTSHDTTQLATAVFTDPSVH